MMASEPAIKFKDGHIRNDNIKDVKIIWKGKRIAKLVFASGKVVEFEV